MTAGLDLRRGIRVDFGGRRYSPDIGNPVKLLRAVVLRVLVLLATVVVWVLPAHAGQSSAPADAVTAVASAVSCADSDAEFEAGRDVWPGAMLAGAEPGLCIVAVGVRVPAGPRETRDDGDPSPLRQAASSRQVLRHGRDRAPMDHQRLRSLSGLTAWHTATPPPLH